MGLLNPILLLLAGAAAVPLLLHLLQRHQGPRVIFPALRYLRRAEKESARRIRLRQILLMLLRVAAVLLVALTAARPFVRAGGVGHAPTAAVLILDNSMSTSVIEGEQRIIELLQARALEVLAQAGPGDRFWLLRAGSPDEPALSGDGTETARRVRDTRATASAADLAAALAHARSLLAAGAEGRAAEIHLLTDLQATSFVSPTAAAGVSPPVIIFHPGSEPPPNRFVAAVEIGGGLAPIADQRSTVTATVGGVGDTTVYVRLIDDRLLAVATVRPGATAVLALPARPTGVVSGRVEIDADALHTDDTRYFAGRVLPPPAVASGSDTAFVDDALEVLASAGRIRRAGTGAADVAILAAATGLDALGAAAAAVVLPPTSPVEAPAVNRRLATAGIPWRFQPPVSGEARFAATGDPLGRTLSDTRLRVVYPLTPQGAGADDSVLLRLADGTPWAVRGERRVGGIYVVLASPLSPEASTLPTSAAMVPLLDRVIGAWALAVPPRSEARAGAEIMLPARASTVVRPDGTRDDVAGGAAYRLPPEPGVYRVMRGDSVELALAVNVPVTESDLERLDRRELEARLPGWTLHVTDDEGSWRRAVFRERLGRELWRPLLAAALAVLVLETIVAAAGRVRRTDRAPATATEVETR
jgi:hypothetical protein